MSIRLLATTALATISGAVAAQDEQTATGARSTVAPDQIIVTAQPLGRTADETTTPVTVIAGDDLIYRRQATLGETLMNEPGINADTFGGGAARPVIRGQTSPRIRILQDGAQIQDASDVSPDHAISSEPLLLRQIEVLRGPAALLYGGGAISGAVNLLDTRIPEEIPARGIAAVAELRGGTADDERTAVGGVTVGAGPFALRAEGVYRDSEDYRAPDWDENRVAGTFNRTRTGTLGGSIVGDNGYFGVAYTRQESEYGVPGHNHDYESCHPHGSSLHCGGHGHEEEEHDHDHDHEEHSDVFVDLVSNRFDVRGELRNPVPAIERIRLRGGFSDYRHYELHAEEHDHDHEDEHDHAHDEDDHEHEAGEEPTGFFNKGHDVRLEVEHAPIMGLRGVVGIQNSRSRFRTEGPEAFLPESLTKNTGVFLFESLEAGPVRFELGARKEWQRIRTVDGRSAEHSPFSISGAGIWTFSPGYSLALGLSRAQRAPTNQELFARGIHLATNTFEIGDAALGKETAHTIDLTFRKTQGPTRITLSAFRNQIDNYIYADTLDRFEDFRLIRYDQRDARFWGFEGSLRQQLTPVLGLAVFGDYVRAKFSEGLDENLPRIPAGRLGARADARSGPLFGELEFQHVFEQDSVADFETATPGYNMLNATVAYQLPLGPVRSEVFLRATNLLDELAYNHVSFVKEAAPLRGRNVVLGVRAAF
ncbi:TonB-dependent receptor domain-containing protein [Tsuneonella amylolytica]|uniref:TonB-dependent receptor domain-containing protein n=1 Tax=Tsuneonella amylolytica TaxID=2338327 RepID=UPI000EAA2475|nr:TonB-dependent receptor [Tsuneonella amylolytica]